MREYLFRGKRKDNGEWVEGYLGQDTIIGNGKTWLGYVVKPIPQKLWDCDWFEIDPATVGQYTGLKDKNGNRIFEGDIVRFEYTGKNLGVEGVETVIFECGKFGVKWGWHKDFVCLDGFANTTKEIIGNIHDNPELIGGRFDVGYTFRV